MSEQSRITVVGTRRRVDVAVPSWTPVGEYAGRLATLCGQDPNDVMPPVWSLAPAGAAALPLDTSLAGAGVVDGQVLYLRDTAGEPADSPVVVEVDEVVAEETHRHRATKLHAGPAAIAAGLLWLVGTAALLAWHTDGGAAGAIALIVVGLLLIGGSWGLTQQKGLVPYGLRLTVAATAIPVLAAGGVLAGRILTTDGYPWESGLVAANLAGLLAFATLAEGALLIVEIELALALATAVLIRGLAADRLGAAAVTAVVAMAVLALARRLAAFVAAWGGRRQATRTGLTDATVELVGESRQVLAAVLAGPVLALAVALPILGIGPNPFALGLLAAVCLALLIRARHCAFTSEVIALSLALTIGGFALVLGLVREFGAGPGTASVMLVLVGSAVVVAGVGLCVLTPQPDTIPSRGPGRFGPRKRSTADVLGATATMALTPLAMGVFGVFGKLLTVGRDLF
ncbi:EsaB/YukD family protein [Micromonospora sp. CA-249363]|uniref:EsaB/YukD family protein n=1 Tax=Micromonospora sp. CA-249363 TaxID=3239963 RepID=UPI003D944E5B